jgi:phosphohistidine phosphatase
VIAHLTKLAIAFSQKEKFINMEVYLIRHGIAADPVNYHSDIDRPLTDEGREKTQKVAQKLREIGLKFDLILTSPLVRARQTAEILQKVGLSQEIKEFTPLANGGDIQAWVKWYTESSYNNDQGCIALVGHQPDLGNWAETLIWGKITGKLLIKKAGVIGLKIPKTGSPVGKSELLVFISPKWLI